MARRSLAWPLRRFRKAEDGAATIEAVLWLPVFIAVFALLADASLLFGGRAHALRVLQDANRSMSIGRLMSTAATEEWIRAQLAELSPNAVVSTDVVGGVIESRVTMPAGDLMATGLIATFAQMNVSVVAHHMSEN